MWWDGAPKSIPNCFILGISEDFAVMFDVME